MPIAILATEPERVPVKVFGVAKTIAVCFRYRNKIGLSVAIEGLQEVLRQRKTTPSEIARQAERGSVATVIRPYLEALTADRQWLRRSRISVHQFEPACRRSPKRGNVNRPGFLTLE